MIRNKLEVGTLIKSLNELEKLKLLLFDKHQYYLFEHIPRPFLIDYNVVKEAEDKEEQLDEENGEKKVRNKKIMGKKKMKIVDRKRILMSNNIFWNKEVNEDSGNEKFYRALDVIKSKGDAMNIIDKRLINIIESIY